MLALFIILVFIIGVRYGQRVEKTNKIVNYLISLPPSPTIQPSQKPLEFKTYKHDGCKIQFLYPSSLKRIEEASYSAKLAGGAHALEFDCTKDSARKLLESEKLATAEIKFKEKSLKGKLKPDIRTVVGAESSFLFTFSHPRTAKNIYVEISKSLYPLFEKSLEFFP